MKDSSTMPTTPNPSPNDDVMDGDLTITTVHADGVTTVAVVGEVDLATADQLSTAGLEAVAVRPRALVVDLTAVPFMDSTGLGHLSRVLAAAYPTPAKVLISSPRLATLFRVTGMANAVEVQQVS